MIILPYSTALTLSKPPIVTYSMVLLCAIVFSMQLGSDTFTESMLYYPYSWNPINMVTCALAHGSFGHLIGNMIFFIAFAPALESLVGHKVRYIWIMVFIAVITSISYSLSVWIGDSQNVPTLGFSGVVSGMIGLSAYLMPKARIRVFVWYILAWKTFYIYSWILAIGFIGMDAWTMFTTTSSGGINLVAHVSGGIAGYLYGVFWLKDRKQETLQELNEEIQVMRVRQKYGKSRSDAFRAMKAFEERQAIKQKQLDYDKFLSQLYQMVSTHRDSEAIYTLMTQYDLDTPSHELEAIYERMNDWGASRTQLCFGRLIIEQLDREQRFGRAVVYIEKCQSLSPQFILPDISRTLFYANLAINTGMTEVAKSLLINSEKRYGNLLNTDQCNHLLQKI